MFFFRFNKYHCRLVSDSGDHGQKTVFKAYSSQYNRFFFSLLLRKKGKEISRGVGGRRIRLQVRVILKLNRLWLPEKCIGCANRVGWVWRLHELNIRERIEPNHYSLISISDAHLVLSHLYEKKSWISSTHNSLGVLMYETSLTSIVWSEG